MRFSSSSFERRLIELSRPQASLYCPGIGKATIVMLQRNLLRLMEYRAPAPATTA